MKAYVLRSYGPPDHLNLADVDTPVPAAGEVLVRVRATSVNPYDWHGMRGEPYVARVMPGPLGLRAPSFSVLGCDMAGQVAAVGADVTGFRPGDGVFALLSHGAFGEYVAVPERLLARKPVNLTYEQAAAVPMAGATALLALRDVGRIESGRSVLVNGASGGVGTFAVQIAVAYGARVHAVCSAPNADLVRSLGAEEVTDYTSKDFTRNEACYDLMLDIAGGRTALRCRRVLARNGTLVIVGGPGGRWFQPAGHVFTSLAMAPLISQRVALAEIGSHQDTKELLTTLTGLIEVGKVTPVVDRQYPFHDLREAVRYQETGHVPGKVVVTVDHFQHA
jgi:NADPH:quinone reductase-like Zn-dependent oxidoreductase